MILIADSGSTKTQWILAGQNGVTEEFLTPGINPVHLSGDALRDTFASALGGRDFADSLEGVRFYGAGCLEWLCPDVAKAISEVTGCGDVKVGSDMLGAAHALCGDRPGIVAILGTGSNSCYYNGRRIVANTPPLGYILGDEGSGARLGIRLVNGVLKGYLPEEICRKFAEETGIDKDTVIERVYRQGGANVFLASLVPFLKKHIAEPEVERVVEEEFGLFLERNIVKAYPAEYAVNFAGSIASVFEEQLRRACQRSGLETGIIAARPLPMLVNYHLNRK